jgi:hypothetical protein
MVPPAGVEPTLANYLLHTGYKSAVLPLNYRGKKFGVPYRYRSGTTAFTEQGAGHYTKDTIDYFTGNITLPDTLILYSSDV